MLIHSTNFSYVDAPRPQTLPQILRDPQKQQPSTDLNKNFFNWTTTMLEVATDR